MKRTVLSLLALLVAAPSGGMVSPFSLDHTAIDFEGNALVRLTSVLPSDPACDDPVQLTVAARGEIASKPYSLRLAIKPGPSYSVGDVVENRINQVSGILVVGEGKQAVDWTVNKFAVGNFHARSQFANGGITLLMPSRFHRGEDLSPSTGIYGLLALKCAVTGPELKCTDLRFVFGNQMGQLVGSTHTIEEIFGVRATEQR